MGQIIFIIGEDCGKSPLKSRVHVRLIQCTYAGGEQRAYRQGAVVVGLVQEAVRCTRRVRHPHEPRQAQEARLAVARDAQAPQVPRHVPAPHLTMPTLDAFKHAE